MEVYSHVARLRETHATVPAMKIMMSQHSREWPEVSAPERYEIEG